MSSVETSRRTPPHAPVDDAITVQQLILDPYPIYKRLRAEAWSRFDTSFDAEYSTTKFQSTR